MNDIDDEHAAFTAYRTEFFALIGHCVTEYQAVEDFLPRIFAAALRGDTQRALAIFGVVRRLEDKLALISAAMTNVEERHRSRWIELNRSIISAAAFRNQVAHSGPVHHSGTFVITDSGDPDIPPTITKTGFDRMELRKKSLKS